MHEYVSSKLDMFLECWRHRVETQAYARTGAQKTVLKPRGRNFYIQQINDALEDAVICGVCKVR